MNHRRSMRLIVLCLVLALTILGSWSPLQRPSIAHAGRPHAPALQAAWAPNTWYSVGALVTYGGSTYKCIQAHTSQVGWEPPNVPALWSLQSGGTPDTQPPTAPTNLTSPSKTSTSVSLSWTASTDNVGVTGYNVYQGTTLKTTVSTTSATVTGLTANTSYTFTVKAKDAAGNLSAASNALTVTTNSSGTCSVAPSVPTGLTSPSKTSTTVNLSWTASNPGANCAIAGYDVYRGTTRIAQTSGTGTTYTATGLTANTTYTFQIAARNSFGTSAKSAGLTVTTNSGGTSPGLPKRVLVGYWHNFNNGSTVIRLRNVSTRFDVIDVAFAESAGDRATMVFTPFNATTAEFKSDIDYLHSIGKKVLISIGGQNGTADLSDATLRQRFIDSMGSIISTYGFDGIDIDLEGGSISLNNGDTNFRSPTTPKIVNLISAVRALGDRFGPSFMVTMAPEIAYVQGGLVAYAGPWGAYLPVIYGLRDRLTFIHVQHYNAGGAEALDGRTYSQGTADFQVAMAEMLLHGFPIARNSSNVFPPLRPDQVAIGLPAEPRAAGGGYTPASEVQKALDYLIKGRSFGGTYVLRNASGYANFRGLMTWSINWDAASNYGFSTPHRTYLNSLP